jgi:3-hydroxyisobutyrate dehydrogenase
MRVACIGVGNMGGAVARRLATSSEFEVTVFDPSKAAVDKCCALGATRAESVPAAVTVADVVLTSLPTTALVLETVGQLVRIIDEDTVIVDISTIDPMTARSALELCAEAGRRFVACPLGKTPAHAENGEIPLFVGGEKRVVSQIDPVLQRIGEKTYYFGSVEAATTFKLVSNYIGMANVAVLSEGLAIALRAGIEPEDFSRALADTGAKSFQSEVRLPWMIQQDWMPRFGVSLATKDVRLAVEAALNWGIPVPVGSATLSQLMSASAHGFGDEDVIAIMKATGPVARRAD